MKRQFWLRPDQIECVAQCLEFSRRRVGEQNSTTTVCFARDISFQRITDALVIFDPEKGG